MLRAARKELGLSTDETVVIGDTMETDILGGTQLEYKTILVLSGSTNEKDLRNYAYQPDLIVPSLAELSHAEVQARLFEGSCCET
jgi:NagD protein